MEKNAEFLKRLLATFQVEAQGHVSAMYSGLLELEKAPGAEKRAGIVETVFREAHSLKGAARSVNLKEIETICQSLESVFSALKRQELALSAALFDRLHKAVDTVGKLLLSVGTEQTAADEARIAGISQEFEDILKGTPPSPKQKERKTSKGEAPIVPQAEASPLSGKGTDLQPLAGEKPLWAGTVRVSAADLDSLLRQAEELLAAKLTIGQLADDLGEVNTALAAWEKGSAKIQPDVRAVQGSLQRDKKGNGQAASPGRQAKTISQMAKVLAFLEWNDQTLQSLRGKLATLAALTEQDHRALSRRIDDLLEDVKRLSMLPFSSLLEVFPKLVRDLSRDCDKDVGLVIQGGEIEADRRIFEEMKDPLIHLVRNCIDHGIEHPKEREKKKKPPQATITIAISPKDSDKFEILVSDDGAGIDVQKVRASALNVGILSAEEAEKLSDYEALSLVFHSGVSASPLITEISGRGLGLAIVRSKVERLGGTVSFETDGRAGTTFRMILPLTLATFRGILVRVEENLLLLPTTYVERVLRVRRQEIKTVENREAIQFNGQAVSLVRIGGVLGLAKKSLPDETVNTHQAVVLRLGSKRIAFLVDEILGEQEALMKSLGKQLSRVRNVSGATVLGGGKVVPVLNVPDLMLSAVKATGGATASAAVKETPARRKSILVAEDSITARTLLKNILESAGYKVTVAVDGVDAFTTLKTEEFDLVVSDVDMPRMSGFELTAKIRADQKLSGIPVVLVTALQSREDRERGIDVGASAYIVKSSFDQSNLLEVLGRLV